MDSSHEIFLKGPKGSNVVPLQGLVNLDQLDVIFKNIICTHSLRIY